GLLEQVEEGLGARVRARVGVRELRFEEHVEEGGVERGLQTEAPSAVDEEVLAAALELPDGAHAAVDREVEHDTPRVDGGDGDAPGETGDAELGLAVADLGAGELERELTPRLFEARAEVELDRPVEDALDRDLREEAEATERAEVDALELELERLGRAEQRGDDAPLELTHRELGAEGDGRATDEEVQEAHPRAYLRDRELERGIERVARLAPVLDAGGDHAGEPRRLELDDAQVLPRGASAST